MEQSRRIPALTWLVGSRVQRVDAPEPNLFAFSLYAPNAKPILLLALSPEAQGVGTLAERPHGAPASAFVRRLRTLVENARLLEASAWVLDDPCRTAALELVLGRRDDRTRLFVDFHPQKPNLYLVDAEGRVLGAADEAIRRRLFPGASSASVTHAARASLPGDADGANLLGTALLRGRSQEADVALRNLARAQAKAALRRAERKQAAIQEDLARAEGATLLRREGSVLLCHLTEIKRGQSSVELVELGNEPAERLHIALDPALSPEQNAERKFARARRLARGVSIATQRLADASERVHALQGFLTQLETLPPPDLRGAAQALGIALSGAASRASESRSARPEPRVPYRIFEGFGDARILVGKGAADNDVLTTAIARPQDIWLHARAIHGAHVVIPRARNVEVPPELLLDAAHLAAHFSAARGERLIEIQHTEKRFVRKPKGAAKGAVHLDREKVLLLRVEPERLARLLAHERAT